MENIEKESPKELYSERDLRCIAALIGEDSYLYHLAAMQKPELIPELSAFLTTSRLTTILEESVAAELLETADVTMYSKALQTITEHLILLCERLSGEKLA